MNKIRDNDRFENGTTDWHNWMRDTMKIDPNDKRTIEIVWDCIGRCKTEPSELDRIESEKPGEDAVEIVNKLRRPSKDDKLYPYEVGFTEAIYLVKQFAERYHQSRMEEKKEV